MAFLVPLRHCQQSTAQTATPERRPLERRTLVPTNTTSWLYLASWNLLDSQLSWVCKRSRVWQKHVLNSQYVWSLWCFKADCLIYGNFITRVNQKDKFQYGQFWILCRWPRNLCLMHSFLCTLQMKFLPSMRKGRYVFASSWLERRTLAPIEFIVTENCSCNYKKKSN